MATAAADRIALPLDKRQSERVGEALAGLTPAQLQWVSGYAAGLAAAGPLPHVLPAASSAAPERALTILFGSQTGNGEGIATALARRAEQQGFAVRLSSLAEYKPAALKRESLLTFVISTHGEGDPPDDAELFHEFLLSAKAPELPGLQYAVLALGDSSYVNFCQTGREFDERLAALGATRLMPIVECDLDYETRAEQWAESVLAELPGLLDAGTAVPHLRAVETTSRFDKHNPFPAEVLVNQKITAAGSSKDVRHIELSIEGSGLVYQPGDSLAVVVSNPPELVRQFIGLFGGKGDTTVLLGEREVTFEHALTSELEITAPSLGFLRAWAERSGAAELRVMLEDGRQDALSAFVDTHQIIDIVRRYPASVDARDFVKILRKLGPRSYSIASSQPANPGEVHLTVAAVRYDAFGSEHWGAASTHLADRLAEGDTVPVYVEPNSRFRLPDDDTPIIMIGPGTGVAPFRAFVEERAERGARGRNWLFFGERNFSSDFLYQLEWQRHLKQGRLQRLDVAFSRDQDEKIYVQDRIRENAAEVYRWLNDGAVVYVCGDAKHMAADVNDALVDVIASQADVDAGEAAARLKALRRSGRYQRDVY